MSPTALARDTALGLNSDSCRIRDATKYGSNEFAAAERFRSLQKAFGKSASQYFRGMVDKFGGSFEYALAAYNAGSDRVDEWLSQGKYRDPQEFVESIPFTETREYVQAILRNASVYKQIYGTP